MSDDSTELGGFGPTTPAHSSLKSKPKSKGGQSASKLSEKASVNVAQTTGNRHSRLAKRAEDTGGRLAKRKKGVKGGVEVVVVEDDEMEGEFEGKLGGSIGYEQEEEERDAAMVVASSDGGERQHTDEMETRAGKGRRMGRVNGRDQVKGQHQRSKSSKAVRGSDEDKNQEEIIHIEPPSTQTKVVARNGTNKSGNGRAAAGKGAAADARGKTQRDEEITDSDEILQGLSGVAALLEQIGKSSVVDDGAKPNNKQGAELARLKEKVNRLEKENEVLSNQMEELFRVRETEAEALLERSGVQYEAKIRALQEVNQALTTQIAKKQPLAGTGKSSILHLITREAADEERQALDREVAKLKSSLEDATRQLSLKEKEIEDLRQTEKDLRFELKAEIDRANSLAKQTPRPPQPTPRSGLIAEDPKHREVVKLYEDLTNIIVLNVRSSPGRFKKDEWLFTCCYTHTNESDPEEGATCSISFSLRSYDDETDGKPTDWIQYLPTQLENESPDFVEKLGFLNAAFQFERNQLALFLRTLYTTIEDIVKDGQESEDEDEEMRG